MSVSKEGMLEFFNALCEESSINFLSARNQDKVLALRRLIEHGPEVSIAVLDGHVGKMLKQLDIHKRKHKRDEVPATGDLYGRIMWVFRKLLAEARVTVKEG